MQTITTVGLDIAKSVFQVHGVDAQGGVMVRRQLRRRYVLTFFKKLPPCLVGIEACATSHHWARELQALGHTVRLMPPAYVKPYVKRQKNDAADAEAICEAVQRPSMRFVPIKTPDQQSCLMLHRTRHLFIRQQTAIINTIRAHLAEFGIVAPVGRNGVEELLYAVADERDERIPEVARGCLEALGASARQAQGADPGVRPTDQRLAPLERDEPAARRAAGRRPGTRNRAGGQRCRSEGVQIGPRLLGLDRSGSEAELERRVERGSAVSPSRETAICAACSRPARWRSSTMQRSTAANIAPGSRSCSNGGRRKSRRSRWPTRSRAWLGR